MTYNLNPPGSSVYNPSTVAVTGGTINGTTIGATTASTGAFSALTGPTRTALDSTTNAATTAFVTGAIATGTSGVSAISTTGGSTTLTSTQYSNAILSVTGTLASNATLVVPTSGRWTVINSTTGAFSLTVKTSGGTGVTITQGFANQVYSDGTNTAYSALSPVAWSLAWEGGTVLTNGTYRYALVAPYNGTITKADYITGNGSFTFAVQIAGVSVTGLSAVAVSSTSAASSTASAANTFLAGQLITLVVTSATSSPTGVVVSLRITKG